MSDISKINLNNTVYTLKDAVARESLADKQDTLISGTTIKTINNQSILTNGNITVPQSVSELINDSKFQTLSDVENLILDELSRFDKLDYKIVTTLPAIGDAGVRYLIKHATDDRYEEYIYVEGQWYDIGSTDEVDLSQYYTKTETDLLIENKQDALVPDTSYPSYYIDADINGTVIKLATKDYVDSKDPFMLLDFNQTLSSAINIPSCQQDIANTSVPNVDIVISDDLGETWAIASLAKYEVFNSSSARLNVWPVCMFSMNGQKTLRLRMMAAGPNSKTATRIAGAMLLKHR